MSIADRILAALPEVPVPAYVGEAPADWPVMDDAAWLGIAAEYAQEADPYTEADPIAVLASTMVLFGTALNCGPHLEAGNDRHPASLFIVLVGQSAKGGKGTSYAVARTPMELADPGFMASRVMSGFGSGEVLIDAVRDPDENDEGARDKRLLIYESEFARMLKVAGRDGSTLSMVIRDGWDGRKLQARSRAKVSVASGHHFGVIGHVVADELRARLSDTEVYGGFGNRFQFVVIRKSKRLPGGGNVPLTLAGQYGNRLAYALDEARKHGLMRRTQAAEQRWAEIYEELAEDDPGGLLGALVARDAPQCLRLSLLYAVLDLSKVIDVQHVEAAYAFWRYCRASAAYIFGDSLGDEVADRLLAALRQAGPSGLTLTEQSSVFGKNQNGHRLDVARKLLVTKGLAVVREEERDGPGRRAKVMFAITKETKSTKEPIDR